MKILVVSDREYKKTSRGIDMITTFLAEKEYSVDHLVFFGRKYIQEKQISKNLRQLYFYDFIGFYRGKMRLFMPGFFLLFYFSYIIKNQKYIDFSVYDWVILESGYPIYLSSCLSNKIIYRQADPTYISFNSNRKFYTKLEQDVIKKSVFTSSALKNIFYPTAFKDKIVYCHSGFIPYINESKSSDGSICFIGGGIDWKLVKKIAQKYPGYKCNIIGFPGKQYIKNNLIFKGYISLDEYQKTMASASVIFIPYSNHFSYMERQTSLSAKLLTSIQLGKPLLVKAYGDVQTTDLDKKLFIYNNHKEALFLLDSILKKIESGEMNYNVSKETQEFLSSQTSENRMKELDKTFSMWIK